MIEKGVILEKSVGLMIAEGKTLTVNNTIWSRVRAAYTLTVNGPGKLIVNGSQDYDGLEGNIIVNGAEVEIRGANGLKGNNSRNNPGDGGNGSQGVVGDVTVNSGSVTVTGGSGGDGGNCDGNGSGGNGGNGVMGNLTVTGGRGGKGGKGGEMHNGRNGLKAKAVYGDLAGENSVGFEESDDGSNWEPVTDPGSVKRYVKAEVKYPLWVGDTQVTSANKDDVLENGTVSFSPASTGDHPTPATLTLNGAAINGVKYLDHDLSNIHSEGIDLRMILKDSNTIDSKTTAADPATFAIHIANGNLTVEGPGTLTANGYQDAIYTDRNCEIKSGRITATSVDSDAIYADEQVIISGGEVTAKTEGEKASGICADDDITINDGTVEASVTGQYSCGISADKITIKDGSVKAFAAGQNGYGISADHVTINDGTVEASATGQYGGGISADHVTIDAGKDTAIGGDIAISRTVKNAMTGTGWTDTKGTQGKTKIEISSDGQTLGNYKKAQFPEEKDSDTDTETPTEKDPATVTKTPEEKDPATVPQPPTGKTLIENSSSQKPVTKGRASGVTLIASVKAKGKTGLVLTWNKVDGVEGYDIFFAKCGKTRPKLVKTIKGNKGNKTFRWTKDRLKKKTAYKALVKAYVMKNGKESYVRSTPIVHAYTSSGNAYYTNAKSVTVKKTSVSLKKRKTYQIKARVNKLQKGKKLMPAGHTPKLRFVSSNKKIAFVSKSGKITARAKGNCKVYVIAVNGASKAIKVMVK